MSTIRGNPHPQINYLILFLIVAGSVLMMLHVRRINREGQLIERFSKALRREESTQSAKALLLQDKKTHQTDVRDVLDRVLELHGRSIGAVQHAAIESEIERFHARQNRRLMLAQFLSGMMVGLGLLGTFIGLLGALSEISKLIGSFSVNAGISNPIDAINALVLRLTTPMQAMGVAFSASLFGVLGSLIMGMLMVFVKSATVELVSMLQSRVSWLTDLAQHKENLDAQDVSALQSSLRELAEHSPVLKGLIMGLDQSERRSQKMLIAIQQFMARVDQNTESHAITKDLVVLQTNQQFKNLEIIENLHRSIEKMVQITQQLGEQGAQNAQILGQQQSMVVSGMQHHNDQAQMDREVFLSQWKAWTSSMAAEQKIMPDLVQRLEVVIGQQGRQFEAMRDQIGADNEELKKALEHLILVIQKNDSVAEKRAETRTALLHQLTQSMAEQKDRYEQLLHSVNLPTQAERALPISLEKSVV